jgi:hypothetical protein
MPGKKGMKRQVDQKSTRIKIWRSMRVMRHFTIPDLLKVVKEANYQNIRNFLGVLTTHGYVAKDRHYISGRTGDFQGYYLIRDVGPVYPCRCEQCGERFSIQFCDYKKTYNEQGSQ